MHAQGDVGVAGAYPSSGLLGAPEKLRRLVFALQVLLPLAAALPVAGIAAFAEGGTVEIRTANVALRGECGGLVGDFVALSVTDDGIGMAPEVLDQAFEPFFTTKPAGKGSGLGLPTIYGFARQCGGGVSIRSRPGEGTTVTVYLPRAAGPRPDVAGAASDGEKATEGAATAES